jgi:molecular chaperone HtpG
MTADTEQPTPVKHAFQAEVTQVLDLVIHSLYSHKEIFLRELVSNASDALDKLRFAALTDTELMGSDPALEIRIRFDAKARTLTIEDTGIGMTEEELVKNLGTVAHSGSRAFLEQVRAAKQEGHLAEAAPGLIGRFGVGFYSAYLVADRVEVTTRAATRGSRALKWTSDAKEAFTIEPAVRAERGTEVVLHLKADQGSFLEPHTLEDLVKRYSDYVAYPIKLEGRQINRASALWQRPKAEITQEQYDELYKHLTHDDEAPLAQTHFRVEGTQEFVGLLYIPRHAPFDLFDVKRRRGVRLFVRRVFIMDDVEELVPPWMRFLRGVIDSDDLPLNVSRELLQDSSALRSIKKQVTKKTLDLLDEIAADKPEDYATFWRAFGVVVKEGLATDHEHEERLAKLVRFESTHAEGALTSLAEYVARMKENQEVIYYAFGESKKAIAGSPYLEAVRARGYEVLFLTDPVDEWAVQAISTFDGKKLVSAMRADLPLDRSDEEKREKERMTTALEPLLAKLKELLGTRVRDVKVSERLTDSPCCLVLPGNASPAFMERLLRERGRDVGHGQRILELNPTHPLIQRLLTTVEKDGAADGERLKDWVEVLYDQAVLAEGGVPEDPNLFARRIATLLTEVVTEPAR